MFHTSEREDREIIMTTTPSKYQQEILDWIENGEGNRACNAVAGSGKSSSLKFVVDKLSQMGVSSDEVKAIVFGKANAVDLAKKLGAGWQDSVATLHSTGFSLVKTHINSQSGANRSKKYNINTNKYWKIAEELDYLSSSNRVNGKTVKKESSLVRDDILDEGFDDTIIKLCNLVRVTLSDLSTENLDYLVEFYEIEGVNRSKLPALALALENMLEIGERQSLEDRILDFTDQIWLPARWQLWEKAWWETYDFVLLDECLPYNTPVLLSDGASIEIGKIVENRLPVTVLSQDISTGEKKFCKVVGFKATLNTKPGIEIKTRRRYIHCTFNHKVWADGQWRYAHEVKVGMMLSCHTEAYSYSIEVESVIPITIKGDYVYDITVEDCHNFYADGILVHNCQDLNAAQIQIATHLAGDTGRILALGDPMQSILGFSGSDAYSYETVRKAIKADQTAELPLSICYRCKKNIISFVRDIFPNINIEAAPGADKGSVTIVVPNKEETGKDYFLKRLKERKEEKWAVLCRLTLPLVLMCLTCLAEDIPAVVKGRDIGAGLRKLIDLIVKNSKDEFDFSRFEFFARCFLVAETKRMQDKKASEQAQALFEEKILAIISIYRSLDNLASNETDIDDLKRKIDRLFADNSDNKVVEFSTIHRYKGLQAEKVAILRPELMPYFGKKTKGQPQEWRLMQEQNLIYVACTRAVDELVILGQASWIPTKKMKKIEDQPVVKA